MSTAEQSQTAEPDAEYDATDTTGAPERGDTDHRPPAVTEGRHSYRTVADALITVGVLCLLAGLATPTGTDVLFALGGIGIFSGVLTAILTTDRFVSASHSEQLYAATARSYHQLCVDLDLSDRRLYVPHSTSTSSPTNSSSRASGHEATADRVSADGGGPISPHDVRLFVPASPTQSLPTSIDLPSERVLVDAGSRGLSVTPIGSGLVAAFLTTLSEPLAHEPQPLATQLSAAVVTDFELARSTNIEFDAESSTLSVEFGDCLYDSHPLFDHPAVSVFAVGLAIGLGRPVDATVTASSPLSATFRWAAETPPEATTETVE